MTKSQIDRKAVKKWFALTFLPGVGVARLSRSERTNKSFYAVKNYLLKLLFNAKFNNKRKLGETIKDFL